MALRQGTDNNLPHYILLGAAAVIVLSSTNPPNGSASGYAPLITEIPPSFQSPSITLPPINPPIEGSPDPQTNPKVEAVVKTALSWVGREYNGNQKAQCAFFVRHVFKQAGYPLPISRDSLDPRPSPASPGMAYSLCGKDIGQVIRNRDSLRPGDIVAFTQTYGSWPRGHVTHVGVYVGGFQGIPKYIMVDRSTSGLPVRRKDIRDYGNKFLYGIRPHLLYR